MIQLRKLLPSNLKSVQRWVDVINTFQNELYDNVITECFLPIKNRFIIEKMREQDIVDLMFMFGFDLTRNAGYTNTLSYLQKQVKTVVPRIENKTTWVGYKYEFYIYLMLGQVYPLLLDENSNLVPFDNWLTFPETEINEFALDIGLFLDQQKDNILYYLGPGETENPVYDFPPNSTLSPWTLDGQSILNVVTRHFLFEYRHRFSESSTEFLSANSMRALYNDVLQIKRAVEIPHFRVILDLFAKLDNTQTTTQYYLEDNSTLAGTQESILMIGKDLTMVDSVDFGDSGYDNIVTTIPGVKNLIASYTLPSSDFSIEILSSTEIEFKSIIMDDSRFFDFSEIALRNSGGDVIMYSKFPTVRFHSVMYSSVRFFANLI